jgi:hypothetical protein
MLEQDNAQWAADTDRLLIAGLSNNIGPTPLDYDEELIEAVRHRCIAKYGEERGTYYFRTLVATLPDRRPDLFPELADQPKIG